MPSMSAAVLEATGDADQIRYQEIEKPAASGRHVLVRVRACAVAQRDLVERRGGHPFLRPPIVQGHEFAGEVVEVGTPKQFFEAPKSKRCQKFLSQILQH